MSYISFIKPVLPSVHDYKREVNRVFNSGRFTNQGFQHNQLLETLKKYLNASNLSLITNGHLALETAIEVFELKGEIITTPFTFPSTTNAIVRNGCTPIFCDVKENLMIDEAKIESLITSNTVAILPVHIFGYICDVEKLEHIANKHNLKLIFDSAHAFGVKYKEKNITEFGDASIISMNITKLFNTIEGGLIAFREAHLVQKTEEIKYFGFNELEVVYPGSNLKMNEMQAIMGNLTIKLVKDEIEKRKRIHDFYKKELVNLPVELFHSQKNVEHNYSYFPILLGSFEIREKLYDFLRSKDIETKKYFYPIVSEQKFYKDLERNINLPNALNLSQRILLLPIYGTLKRNELSIIIKSIRKFFISIGVKNV